jgi:hypothetical protein
MEIEVDVLLQVLKRHISMVPSPRFRKRLYLR